MPTSLKVAPAAIVALQLISAATANELVFPPLDSPKLHFGTGKIINRRPEIASTIPAIPGKTSEWTLLQWRKTEYMAPAELVVHDIRQSDKFYGAPQFSWRSTSGESALNIYSGKENLVYQLVSRDGYVDRNGASDVILSAEASVPDLTADHPLTLSADIRVARAKIRYDSRTAQESGDVLAQSGFMLRTRFSDPATRKMYSVMLGLPTVTSRDNRPDHRGCHFFGENRVPQLVSNSLPTGSDILPFIENISGPKRLIYNVNEAICRFISQEVPCRGEDGSRQVMSWPESARDLKNWRVDSMSFGVETQNHHADRGDTAQGTVEIGVDISNLQFTRSNSLWNGGYCPK